ncbi:MAG: dipeptide epimerase [Pirellulaceae bacterium]|nr:dipeptide epimerase [Pirellulaceae bacterium]
MKLRLHEFQLPLRHEFTISRGSMTVQPTLIVELEEAGQHGYGEATSSDYYGVTLAGLREAIEAVRPRIEAHSLADPARLWAELQPALAEHPFALCAIDQAAYDLWGKKHAQPVYRMWGLSPERMPVSNYTIGIDRVEVMVAKMREFPQWPIYKIKLGTPQDLEIVRELRRHTAAVFRVDANCGWTADETLRNAEELSKLNVQFIEQPLPADRWEDMGRLHRESALPLIADESCQAEDDVQRCHERFHGINIKLVKCGGLTPARRMIARARQLGMKVMVGCMTESTVGISAIAQLLPLLDYVDMDGAVLLAQDIATGVSVVNGVAHFPLENGSGVHLIQS